MDCLICRKIKQIKESKNPYFVAELNTGYVVLGDIQFFRGYTLFLCKIHTDELHLLNLSFRRKFLEEMSIVAEATYKAFKPKKLNYELLGNANHHLHWHIFPRYINDSNPKGPIWLIDESIRNSKKFIPTKVNLEKTKIKLLKKLNRLIK